MERPTPKQLAEARELIRLDKKARKAERPARSAWNRTKPKFGKEADPLFAVWQHEEGLPCICCLVEGPPSASQLLGEPNPIEVAHQRVSGWKVGVKEHDRNSVPLCRWHHQNAPNACDKGQKKFWARVGLFDLIADFCRDLHHAFTSGGDGHRVIAKYVRIALTNRDEAGAPRKEPA
ncbi:MAG TPA: hypothetical protein VIO94_16150 [Phenylobacterium sp.]